MSEQMPDIPFKSSILPKLLVEDTRIRFRCHTGISCFNACCKRADVTLAPYDIIRLKERLGMTSTDFLAKHTVPFEMDADGLMGVKLKTNEDGACLLLDGDKGCGVYSDRPTVCRYYPLGLLAMHPKGATEDQQHYSMVVEAHCRGHEEDRELTIAEYRAEQGVQEYDDANREWYQLLLKKRSAGPTVGRPPLASLQLFFLACYDVDRFRRFVLSDNFKATYALDAEVYAMLERDDVALLRFGFRLLRQVLFGERTIDEQPKAWEKRAQERAAVWEARVQAEKQHWQEQQEARMREETTGKTEGS
jgi:hypothetical protein